MNLKQAWEPLDQEEACILYGPRRGRQGDSERKTEDAESSGTRELGPAQGSFTAAYLISILRNRMVYPLLQRRTTKLGRVDAMPKVLQWSC